MDVISACPLRVASRAWRSIHGAWTLTVVCKGTFLLAPGATRLAPEQEAPNERDVFQERGDRRILPSATDIVPFKPRADVVLVGSAWAPAGWQARTITTRLAVGELDKVVEVACERSWGPGGQRVEAFGPIAPDRPARVAKLGPHAGRWSSSRWWEQPLPEGFDPGFFNAAPPDQQLRSLRGDEALILENLNVKHPRLEMSLPAVRPRMAVVRGSSLEEGALGCDTLWLDTDRGIGTLVWRGWVRLRDPAEAGAVVVTLEQSEAAADSGATLVAGLAETGRVLPFREAPTAGEEEESAVSTEARREQRPDSGRTVTMAAPLVPASDVLPFREAELSPGAAGVDPEPKTARAGAAVTGENTGRRRTTEVSPEEIAAAVAAGALPFGALSPKARAQEAGAQEAGAQEARAIETVQPPTAPFPPLPPLPAPPPMIGPLAKPEWLDEKREGIPAKARAESIVRDEASPEPGKEATSGLPLDEYPLERCAAIAASIARRRQDKARILEENELSAELWEDLKKHWDGEIGMETRRSKTDLLRRYDATYVAELEKERGPISAQEVARLAVAKERGTLEDVLEQLDLPKGAVVRVERMWLQACTLDATRQMNLREAIKRERLT